MYIILPIASYNYDNISFDIDQDWKLIVPLLVLELDYISEDCGYVSIRVIIMEGEIFVQIVDYHPKVRHKKYSWCQGDRVYMPHSTQIDGVLKEKFACIFLHYFKKKDCMLGIKLQDHSDKIKDYKDT